MAKTYLTEKEYKAMEYALLYVKKDIDKVLEEVIRDLQELQTANPMNAEDKEEVENG